MVSFILYNMNYTSHFYHSYIILYTGHSNRELVLTNVKLYVKLLFLLPINSYKLILVYFLITLLMSKKKIVKLK